ncbi:MAG: MFS transporter [Clostridiales bacterium]|nr:MFS transporter [Clostridiales bacterium]MDY6067289.1 MFS transporter [Candidatus Faecousia sp.]
MKLDTKRTVLVGFAFLSICAFWQMYDNLVPLILTNTFHLNETISGAIMAADNVMALFLLPLFGGLSDKCTSRLGRRRPFILFGTLAAICLMLLLPLFADSYHAAPGGGKIALFICVLGLLLVAMGTYRSPAVALMPDITPKPLRSKANAIINLMGAVGGILYLLITTFLYHVKSETYVSFFPLFAIVAGIMAAALAVVMFFVNEPELVKKQQEYDRKHPEDDLTEHTAQGDTLPADVKKSLTFLLVSISLWFVGYNGVSTWFSVYAENIWGMSLGQANTCLTIATGGAILSYIPIGTVASHIGRRKTIRFGALLLSGSFLAAFLLTMALEGFSPVLYVLFLLVGLAWASINVNSLPMVVEMCKGSEVGKFTGLYYTFSMSAQIITPIVAGWLLRNVSYRALFPYAAVFVFASFLTMGFVRHGDNKVPAKKGLEAYDVED